MSTDRKDIEKKLKRYWAAESSLEEENVLREDAASLPEGASELFSYFADQRQVALRSPLQLPYKNKARVVPLRRRLWVAAAVAVMLAGAFFVFSPSRQTAASDPAADIAYQQVTEALFFISEKMNKGLTTADASLQQVQPLNDIFN